jgi:uncharacterized protein YceH (UPF0502 family)
MRELTRNEARVVAVLVEKQATVPDVYPMSLNSLLGGCNQKTARDPVLELREADVLAALDELKALSLVFESSGARVVKYEHNLGRALPVPGAAVALLATLMLRGPQTAAELRLNSERLHRFADVSSVEGFLDELSSKSTPLVKKLAKAPGAREARWAHLLCGEPAELAAAVAVGDAAAVDVWDELRIVKAEQLRLAADVAALRRQMLELRAALGDAADPA